VARRLQGYLCAHPCAPLQPSSTQNLEGGLLVTHTLDYACAPNRFEAVRRMAATYPTLTRPEFISLVAAHLAFEDARWGRMSVLNGPVSTHSLGYRVAPVDKAASEQRVIVVRIIGGSDGLPEGIIWKDYGEVDGRWYDVQPVEFKDTPDQPNQPAQPATLEERVEALEKTLLSVIDFIRALAQVFEGVR